MRSALRFVSVIALLVTLFAGCESPRTGQPELDDAALSTAVKTKLAAEKVQTLTSVDVDTAQGIVSLSGTVESEAVKQRAAELARQVEGVREVVNNLQVKASG